MWENNIKQHYKVKIPLNFLKLCSEVDSFKGETTLDNSWKGSNSNTKNTVIIGG